MRPTPEARRLSARGLVCVAALPISRVFRPRDQGAARDSLGLPASAFVVLVTGGAWGWRPGTSGRRLAGAGRAHPDRRGLRPQPGIAPASGALGEPRSRLVPLGFVDIMPELMASADVVVTNAGGVTSLEAFASARPLLLVDPIAGHGRANSAMMEEAGLAVVCPSIRELQSTVAELVADGALVARMRAAELAHLKGRDLGDDLALLAAAEPLPLPLGHGMRLAARTLTASAALTALLVQGLRTVR